MNQSFNESPCPVGSYCPLGSFDPTQSYCQASTFSDIFQIRSQDECQPCLRGSYCDGTAGEKADCDAGNNCENGSDNNGPTSCPVGHECSNGFANPCPSETYQDEPNQTTCKQCPDGVYCETVGSETYSSERCANGYFCEKGAKRKDPTEDPNGNDNYGACPVGHYCQDGIKTELKIVLLVSFAIELVLKHSMLQVVNVLLVVSVLKPQQAKKHVPRELTEVKLELEAVLTVSHVKVVTFVVQALPILITLTYVPSVITTSSEPKHSIRMLLLLLH